MTLRAKAEEALKNPNVLLFLDLLAEAEGASKGYQTLFGGSTIQDLSKHPGIYQDFYNSTTKEIKRTSAAGRYQFKKDSWDEQAGRLGLTDFSPHSQDLAAIGLMMYKPKSFQALMDGNFDKALKDYGSYWASLPSSPHKQPHRSQQWVREKLEELQSADLRTKHLAMAGVEPPPPVQLPSVTYNEPPTSEDWLGVPYAEPQIELSPFEGIPPQGVTPPADLNQWQGVPFAEPTIEVDPHEGIPSEQPLGTFLDQHLQSSVFGDPQVVAGINADAERARNQAVAAFTGNPMNQSISLPKALESSIRKLLVDL